MTKWQVKVKVYGKRLALGQTVALNVFAKDIPEAIDEATSIFKLEAIQGIESVREYDF